ncbi:MAG TPA: ABC transporter ATP-binding protein [Chthonomonadaceae bacterium]|nr:ABC transporter ATP-binding protein [Chthonomonadaceae bacterium]
MADLVRVENLVKHFPIGGGLLGGPAGVVKAVDGISFTVRKGETLGLVGESGSGKSTTGRLLLRLIEPTSGKALFGDSELFGLGRSEMGGLRRKMQIVFQDPYGSLNPRMSVSNILREGLEPRRLSRLEQEAEISRLLDTVGLRSAHRNRYPHEFSGGQRQRIGIARALAVQPEFLIADEPVSALDVSIQAQVLNLLLDLQQTLGLTMLFIAHDLAVVRHMSDRIAVMYLGKIVELAPSERIYADPRHPYTRTLLAAIPRPDPDAAPARPPAESGSAEAGGCVFRARCSFAQAVCSQPPPLREIAPGQHSACHFAESLPDYAAGDQ